MEKEILEQLTQIKWIVLSLFALVFLTALFFVVASAFRVRVENSRALLLVRDNYLAELSLLEARGEYDQLLEQSEAMLRGFPNDLMANWYNALGNRKTGQLGAALSALGRIQSINKSWSSEAVEDFIREVKAEMGGPRANDA